MAVAQGIRASKLRGYCNSYTYSKKGGTKEMLLLDILYTDRPDAKISLASKEGDRIEGWLKET